MQCVCCSISLTACKYTVMVLWDGLGNAHCWDLMPDFTPAVLRVFPGCHTGIPFRWISSLIFFTASPSLLQVTVKVSVITAGPAWRRRMAPSSAAVLQSSSAPLAAWTSVCTAARASASLIPWTAWYAGTNDGISCCPLIFPLTVTQSVVQMLCISTAFTLMSSDRVRRVCVAVLMTGYSPAATAAKTSALTASAG